MEKKEFIRIRKKLNRTQQSMGELLCVSKKTIESYEQGLRNIPDNMSRITYYLLFKLNMEHLDDSELCWNKNKCSMAAREKCIAWAAQEGFFCWFLNLKTCCTKQIDPKSSSETCFDCDFFVSKLKKILD